MASIRTLNKRMQRWRKRQDAGGRRPAANACWWPLRRSCRPGRASSPMRPVVRGRSDYPGMGISCDRAGEAGQAVGVAAELFSAVTLGSDAERALVVAYWMQKVRRVGLRRLHHQQGAEAPGLCGQHITRPDAADRAQPQLAIQTHKSGSSKQRASATD